MLATTKRELAVAKKLASLFEGRDWHDHPSANQRTFQTLMLKRAKAVLKIADQEYKDDIWEK